jgi:hypothetical protein
MKTLTPEDLDQAKLDPGSVFAGPEEVLTADLSTADKTAILERWEEDAEALIRASEEGMPAADNRSPSDMLGAIQKALHALGSKP